MFEVCLGDWIRAAVLALVFIIVSGAAFAEATLVGYWKLDEGAGEVAEDSSGNAIRGRVVNGPLWRTGVAGQALYFTGQEDCVVAPHADAINLGGEGQSYAVSFWFCSVTPPTKEIDAHFITKAGLTYPFSFVQTATGDLQFRTYDGTICAIVESGMDLSDGDWHLVVGVRDGAQKRLLLYVDGLLVSSAPDTTKGDLSSVGPLRIGHGPGDDFRGLLDEVKLYSGFPTREEMQPPQTRPKRPTDLIDAAGEKRIPAKRAEGIPAMRKLAENWSPTLADDGQTACTQADKGMELKNAWMAVSISAESGEITSLEVRGKHLLTEPGGVTIRDVLSDLYFGQQEGKVVDFKMQDNSPGSVTAVVRKQYAEGYTATITYTLGAQALCCDVRLETELQEARECRISFSMPLLSAMTKLFWAREGAPFDLAAPPAELLVYRQSDMNTNMALPSLTAYDRAEDVGLSFVAPFDLPKPGLDFEINPREKHLGVSYFHLRLAKGEPARAAIYIIPHEGCWRPSLAWMLKTYPEYFHAGAENAIETPGWYWLGGSQEGREVLDSLSARGCKWYQIHNYFPFYGLYTPKTETWDVVVGLADQGKASLEDWEEGKDQGGYANSYDLMRESIRLRQESGIQALLYLQSFELWDQYAAKYFADDIARARTGRPITAWSNCNLMNPDPAFAWGQNVVSQVVKVQEEYPTLDGIFYDRDDYKQYDYAHDDGVSMNADIPCYTLALAQQQINDVISGKLHEQGMAILTNGPTSIEVCKGFDGIMCENNGWAGTLQYLGLVRPIVLLPFFLDSMTYDTSPAQTEEKLKMALTTGLFPSLTYGGEDSQHIDSRFRPLVELMKDREWVLNAHALVLPDDLRGNIFRSPEGYYIVSVVDFAKSRLDEDQTPRSVEVKVTVPDAGSMKYCYVLSSDYMGPIALPFACENDTLTTTLPCHLTCSMLVFSKAPRFEIARRSSPLLSPDQSNILLFDLYNPLDVEAGRSLCVRTPWFEETRQVTLKGGEVGSVTVDTGIAPPIPEGQIERTFTVDLDGTTHEMSVLCTDQDR